ncbi:unnamed protein product [Calicophoron daubneyi]|uniref:Major facilitator superfamily (MFS) profile domain-containing protein n=1 Tax=Calicophoron daubneyi TaxID=300641 RepID=A0AAV2TDN2_CALDB
MVWKPGYRHLLAITVFFYCIIGYTVRVGINTTILSMVNDTVEEGQGVNATPVCPKSTTNTTKHKTGTYSWDRPTQGIILGAFFWGYIILQIPGALMCLRFGPRKVGLVSIIGFSVVDICLPYTAVADYRVLLLARFLEGLFEGVMIPLGSCLIGRWATPTERSGFSSFIFSGVAIGTVLGQVIAGAYSRAQERFDEDHNLYYVSYWEYAHFTFGGLGLLLAVVWFFTVYSTPDEHPRISANELALLTDSSCTELEESENTSVAENSPTEEGKNDSVMKRTSVDEDREISRPAAVGPVRRPKVPSMKSVPWKQMLASKEVWSIFIVHFALNWTHYIMITSLPTYMARVQNFEISENGLLSSIPFVAEWAVSQLAGTISDTLIRRRVLSATWIRRLASFVALAGSGTFVLAVGFVGCNRAGAVSFLTIAVGLLGVSFSGYAANMVDIAPSYAGNIMSISNTLGTLPGIFGPMLVGYVTKDSSSLENWMIVFSVSAAIAWFGALQNMFLTRSVLLPWGTYKEDDDENLSATARTVMSNEGSMDDAK